MDGCWNLSEIEHGFQQTIMHPCGFSHKFSTWCGKPCGKHGNFHIHPWQDFGWSSNFPRKPKINAAFPKILRVKYTACPVDTVENFSTWLWKRYVFRFFSTKGCGQVSYVFHNFVWFTFNCDKSNASHFSILKFFKTSDEFPKIFPQDSTDNLTVLRKLKYFIFLFFQWVFDFPQFPPILLLRLLSILCILCILTPLRGDTRQTRRRIQKNRATLRPGGIDRTVITYIHKPHPVRSGG